MKLAELVFTINFPIIFGYLIRLKGVFNQKDGNVLRKFTIKITVPFIIFTNIYSSKMSDISQIYSATFALVVLTALFLVFSIFITRFLIQEKKIQNSIIIASFVGNYGYLGWGVLYNFYGNSGFLRSVFFTVFFWPVFLFAGFFVVYLQNRKENSFSKKEMFFVMLKNGAVPILTVLVSLFFKFSAIKLPIFLMNTINSFAKLTIPIILFTIGLNFSLKTDLKKIKAIVIGVLIHLLFGFGLGFLTIKIVNIFFSSDILMQKVILIESIMPTAAISPFFTEYMKSDKEIVSGILTYSTLISLITIPFWFIVVERMFNY